MASDGGFPLKQGVFPSITVHNRQEAETTQVSMDGWLNGSVGGCVDGLVNGWVGGCMDLSL